jgi:transcriptional regulator with XRE-family HTH domain
MLGEELRRAREKAGLSQEEVAHRAGIDRSYLSQLENDRKSPTVDLLLRVCGALGTKMSTLIGRVERKRAKGTK